MRVRRLALLRYGHFTDRAIDLPCASPDIHIVYGPNEAGKSTALNGLEDLLFGIPKNSRLNFLHDYPNMRLGAIIEANSKTLAFRRRKGNKDTLLTPEDTPLPGGDSALAPFLAGADREFFARMFFLDHHRLRRGGQEILEARDEVGQALFSAGAGLEGLRERLIAMDEHASALWGPRRAGHRAYYQADDALKAADAALRERTVTVSQWASRKEAFDEAHRRFAALEAEIQTRQTALRKLQRIRRVYLDVHRHQTLSARLRALGEVAVLPDDAQATLVDAEQADRDNAARISLLQNQLASAERERDALIGDAALLIRADDIRQLHEQRIRIRAEQAELPQHRAELATIERRLLQLGGELGWEDTNAAAVAARLPTRADINRANALLSQHARLCDAEASGSRALAEAEERLAAVDRQLTHLPPAPDITTLAALIRATRDSGDPTTRIGAAARDERHALAVLERLLAGLNPPVPNAGAALAVAAPSAEAVERQRDYRRDLDQRLETCRSRLRAVEQERQRLSLERARLLGTQRLVAPEQLRLLRQHRDAGWHLILRHHIEGETVDEDALRAFSADFPDLPTAFEAAVSRADLAADQRFEEAEGSARLAVLDGALEERTLELDDLRDQEQTLLSQREAWSNEWRGLWAEAPFEPASPDEMLAWLARRQEIAAANAERKRAVGEIEALQAEARSARDRLLAELRVLEAGPQRLGEQPLPVVVEAASDVLQQVQKTDQLRGAALDQQQEARHDVVRKHEQLEETRRQQADWETHWHQALTDIGLKPVRPQEAPPLLDTLEDMRSLVTRAAELRDQRIGPAEARMMSFQREVAGLVATLAPDLSGGTPEESALVLERRFQEATRIQEARAAMTERIDKLNRDIEGLEAARQTSLNAIRHLHEIALTETLDELRAAIDRSEQHRALRRELDELEVTLAQAGDGFDLAHLQTECHDVDLDQIVTRETAQASELEDLRQRLLEARDLRNQAAADFEAIGGDDGAARAASDREAALAHMEEIAERYVRVRTAALLLQWGIDRYRQEKQAPLLRRAGSLFARLTDNSFQSLALRFDDQDRARLAGIRGDGSPVDVDAMSSGTADQLYLALRIAAVEDYVTRSGPLPFVADDLFVNFDDQRAASGFAVLGELAQRCQVIYFTHHEHLLEVAASALGGSASVIKLAH